MSLQGEKGCDKKGPSRQGLERLQTRISMADSLVIHATLENYKDIHETKTHRRSLQDSAGNAGLKESQFNFYCCEICFMTFYQDRSNVTFSNVKYNKYNSKSVILYSLGYSNSVLA